jgi:Family of unknown function (DUF5678)
MMKMLQRVIQRLGYACGMGRETVEPERRLADLDRFQGCWVAVKDGKVVAAARTSIELVPELRKLGEAGAGAVAQYVLPQSSTIMIGVG